LKITPQTVLFNDEDFHSVENLETGQIVWSAGSQEEMSFCKVTPVSIQAFVEVMLRLANVLEATNGTLRNVKNICTLAINSAKYFVLFSGVSQHSRLSDHSLEDFNRMKILIIEQNCLWRDLQLENRERF
jgi:hypothetical protein